MAKKEEKIILSYSVDKKSLQEAERASKQVIDSLMAIARAEGVAAEDATALARDVQTLTQMDNHWANALKESAAAAQRNGAALKDNQRAVREYGDAYREASDRVESFGDVSTNISAISGLARGVGLGGVADVGMLGADITDAVEGLGRLGPALRQSATNAQAMIQNVTGASVSLGALGAAAGILVVGIGAVVAAIELWRRANEEAVNAVRAWISGTQEANQILRGGLTSDQAAQQLDEWNQTIRDNTERIALLRRSYEQITDGTGVLTTAMDALNVRGIQDMRTEIEQLETQNRSLNISIGELNNERGQEIIAVNDTAVAEEELAQVRETRAVQAANATREAEEQAARDRVAALQTTIDAMQRAADQDKEIARLSDTSARQKVLRASSGARESQLQSALADFAAKTAQQIEDLTSENAGKQAALQRKFMQQSIKDTQAYYDKEAEADNRFNKERLRRLEDLADDLQSAEDQNNVVAFIQAQRRADKDLRRMDEDASDAEKTRSEEFKATQEQRAAEFEQERADLQAALNERIAQLQRGLEERRAQTRLEIQTERDALRQRLYDLQQATRLEVAERKRGYAEELTLLQQQNQQRMMLDQKLADGLNYAAAAAAGLTGGSTAAARTTYQAPTTYTPNSLAGRLASATSSAQRTAGTTFNISMGNIGSDVSRKEVSSAFTQLASALQSSTVKAIAGVKG